MRLKALEAAAREGESVEARGPSAEPERKEKKIARARKVNDLLDRFANYLILPCVCGIRIKVPPDLNRDEITCSRCDRVHPIPQAEKAADPINGAAEATGGDDTLKYERREKGWEGFRCACGQTIQLGPDFPLYYTACVKCNRRIELKADRQGTAEPVVT